MKYKKIVVAGGGVLGSQIAFQAAYCGYDVTIWLRSEGSITRCEPKLKALKEDYLQEIEAMANGTSWARGIATEGSFNKEECIDKVNKAFDSIKKIIDKKEAYKDADLVIESMSEIKNEKIEFYKDLCQYLDEKTVVVTNSSTLLPSEFSKYTGRKEKFLSLHFANHIWKNNTAEIMASPDTDQKYFQEIVEFANSIGMVALPVLKEKNGYLLNSMLVPFLLSGLDMYASGVSDPESIDKAWTLGTGAPKGPFAIIDTVGLQTAYNIVVQFQKVPSLLSPILKKMMMPYNFKAMLTILKEKIDKGETGKAVGKGFFTYK